MNSGERLSIFLEKLFCGDKSYLGNKSMRTGKNEFTESKIFVEFVALIVRSKIYTCLKEKMKEIIMQLLQCRKRYWKPSGWMWQTSNTGQPG